MKATIRGRYDVETNDVDATLSLTANAGDVRMKCSINDATFANQLTIKGIAFAIEKPNAFVVDYNATKNDLRFQFMNSVKWMDKAVNLSYTHAVAENRTSIDGTFVFDPCNKISVNYVVGSDGCKIRYVSAHGEMRRLVIEPCYDTEKNSWDFAVSNKFEGGDLVRANYQTSTKKFGVEWTKEKKRNGTFKVSASINLAEKQQFPKLIAERTWNYDL